MADVGGVINGVLRVLPVAWDWIRARIESGESPEEVIRDIKDRSAEIQANREDVADAFESKFGEEL